MNVELERRVVALLGVVEMNEEEDVRPDVMFVVDVVLEALTDRQTGRYTRLSLSSPVKNYKMFGFHGQLGLVS